MDFEVKAYIANAADSADEIEKKYACTQSNNTVNSMLYCNSVRLYPIKGIGQSLTFFNLFFLILGTLVA